jgi:hypothetical protein
VLADALPTSSRWSRRWRGCKRVFIDQPDNPIFAGWAGMTERISCL